MENIYEFIFMNMYKYTKIIPKHEYLENIYIYIYIYI